MSNNNYNKLSTVSLKRTCRFTSPLTYRACKTRFDERVCQLIGGKQKSNRKSRGFRNATLTVLFFNRPNVNMRSGIRKEDFLKKGKNLAPQSRKVQSRKPWLQQILKGSFVIPRDSILGTARAPLSDRDKFQNSHFILETSLEIAELPEESKEEAPGAFQTADVLIFVDTLLKQ